MRENAKALRMRLLQEHGVERACDFMLQNLKRTPFGVWPDL